MRVTWHKILEAKKGCEIEFSTGWWPMLKKQKIFHMVLAKNISLEKNNTQEKHKRSSALLSQNQFPLAKHLLVLSSNLKWSTLIPHFVPFLVRNFLSLNTPSPNCKQVLRKWVPAVKAPDQLNGYGLSFIYTNETSGTNYDRTFQVYWDLQMTGEYEQGCECPELTLALQI